MLRLSLHQLNLKLRYLSRELLEQLILLTELDGQLIGLHIKCRSLQLRLDQLLFDRPVRESHLLQLLVQILVLRMDVSNLLFQLLNLLRLIFTRLVRH